jgi:hypothetical protein
MSNTLTSRDPHLKKLVDDGYSVGVDGMYLTIGEIPYVSTSKQVETGILVAELNANGPEVVGGKPRDHTVWFVGGSPCETDGNPITSIPHQEQTQSLTRTLVVNRKFSNKGEKDDENFHDKMIRYIWIIAAPARALDPSRDPRQFTPRPSLLTESPFEYQDTHESRAGIHQANSKVAGRRIAIVGVGGTGGYILDCVAKTPVREIHLFDADKLQQHNAFRAPGAASLEDLEAKEYKVEYFKRKYGPMRRGIEAHPVKIVGSNVQELAGFDFVFLAAEAGEEKAAIIDYLVTQKIPFVYVGMGVTDPAGVVRAILTVTAVTPVKSDHAHMRIVSDTGGPDAYASNIQIVELNMLNAAMAVIKWKQLAGFYADDLGAHHLAYATALGLLDREDRAA